MKNRRKNWLIAGVAAAALLEFVIIVALLLPANREPAVTAAPPAAEPAQLEQRLSAGASRNTAAQPEKTEKAKEESPAAEADAPEETASGAASAAEPPEVQEKEKPEGEQSATEILANARIVAHGMGAIGGLETPNCLEAFQAQYEAGVRVFEADLRLTRDGRVVLRHDWWPDAWQEGIDWARIPTLEKFKAEKILGEYTPLSFQDLLLLMEQYPDICVITDTKFVDSDVFFIQFDSMLADAHELGLTYLFDRMFIQVYSGNMRTAVNNIYPFPHYIYTLYQDEEPFKGTTADFRKKAAYSQERGIEGITMSSYWWKPEYAAIAEEYGLKLYVHTVNKAETAQKMLDAGVAAIYSDSLTPGDLS